MSFTDSCAKRWQSYISRKKQEQIVRTEKKLMEQYHINVETIAADLANADAAEQIYAKCAENNWKVDILINNAGFGGRGDFVRERNMEQDMRMIAVNIETPTRMCKLFIPDMIKRGSGRVLNVSSIASKVPGPLQAVYFASKAYVTSMSNALWRELKGTGVTVTALMPGAMKTGFVQAGNLSDTKLFEDAVEPMKVAKSGYKGMMKGKMNVTSGLAVWQRPFFCMVSLFPKKPVLDFIYRQQVAGSAKRKNEY